MKSYGMRIQARTAGTIGIILLILVAANGQQKILHLPTSKDLMEPLPGAPRELNSFPATIAVSPDGQYLAVLNSGYGTVRSAFSESIAIVDFAASTIQDFPDARMGQHAQQTFFQGLAFSADGQRLFASVGSMNDPERKHGGTGNGIAVYRFAHGAIQPEKFLSIPTLPAPPGKVSVAEDFGKEVAADIEVPFPASLAVMESAGGERLLVADNLSDDAVLLDAESGKILRRFDLSRQMIIPAEYPYAVAATRDGKTGYVTLWNDSSLAVLDLEHGNVRRYIGLRKPGSPAAAGSHPCAVLLSPDEHWLYIALANQDEIAVLNTDNLHVHYVDAKLPGQKYGGASPNALAQSADGRKVFVANAGSDAVAVFDAAAMQDGKTPAMGFIPTGWYPSAVAVVGKELFVATAKGHGTGPNNFRPPSNWHGLKDPYSYIPTLLYGSLARIQIDDLAKNLPAWSEEVMQSNRMRGKLDDVSFALGHNPIRHVIYVIKENRTFDQVLGDIGVGDADPSLTMYGESITPNEHELARQFGVLDNFYDSGEVSGDGHVWSTAGISSDYTERTWQIGYRSGDRSYDYEGVVGNGYPLEEKIADVDDPGTGYLWSDFARHKISYRHYGEFISSKWCNRSPSWQSPLQGTPMPPGEVCPRSGIRKGEPLPANVGDPPGGPSPWPWEVPILGRNVATKPELRDHFDPRYPDFNLKYPDQLRADEFLNEFREFAAARAKGKRDPMPHFILLRLPNDHTSGTRPGWPTPAASLADNDLAVGRVVDAISHSAYWDDTAIFVLEDDAQGGPDHVDAHRSIALVISKYAPLPSGGKPTVEHTFYTTVNVLRTLEWLLGAPPMNNNDARAALMAPLLTGPGTQPAFNVDTRNRDNGLIYSMNPANAPGAQASAKMDFSRADAANADELNRILWRDRMKDKPYPEHRRGGR